MTCMGDERWEVRLRPDAISRVTKHLSCTRSALQRRMGVAEATLWRVERGDVLPSNTTIAALIATSGMAFDDLFEIIQEPRE